MKEHHDVSHPALLAPRADHALGTQLPDPWDLAQPLGLVLDHVEDRVAERRDQPLRELRTNAAHEPRREVAFDALGRDGLAHVEALGAQLRAVSRIFDPAPCRLDALPGDHVGRSAHHRPELAASGPADAQDADARFLAADRAPLAAHLAGHLHALDALPGPGAGTDRAAMAEGLVSSVCPLLDLEAVSLDDSRVAFALGGADRIHVFARLEDVAGDLGAHLVALGLLGVDPALAQVTLESHTSLLEVPLLGLREELLAAISETELKGRIAIRLLALLLNHEIWAGFENGHRNRLAALVENPGHADLSAQQFDRHLTSPRQRLPGSRRIRRGGQQ